jgi:hypothetical protein
VAVANLFQLRHGYGTDSRPDNLEDSLQVGTGL